MENIQTPISNRIMDWLIYGNRENYKKPLESNLENSEERLERFKSILDIK